MGRKSTRRLVENEQNGEGYDVAYAATPHLFGAAPEPVLVRFADRIEGDGPVLDVGCGQGRNSLWLARRGYRVVAVDPSLEAVVSVAEAAADTPLTTIHGPFTSVPSRLGPYAAVCVFGLLQILTPDQRQELLEAVEAWSRPGTLLFLTAWTTADPGSDRVAADWRQIGVHSFASDDGRVRSYLAPGAARELLPGWRLVHHREGLGPWHRHGDGARERHGVVELVALC